MRAQLLPALRMLLLMTVLTGVLYPLGVTGVAQLTMPGPAGGSLVERGGVVVGSELQAQAFQSSAYFHPRPGSYDGSSTGGSGLGPSNPELLATVEERVAAYRERERLGGDVAVPADAVTESGSGLDPDISVANALLQAPRVAAARDLPLTDVLAVVNTQTTERTLGFLGERRVNVLLLNLELDDLSAGG